MTWYEQSGRREERRTVPEAGQAAVGRAVQAQPQLHRPTGRWVSCYSGFISLEGNPTAQVENSVRFRFPYTSTKMESDDWSIYKSDSSVGNILFWFFLHDSALHGPSLTAWICINVTSNALRYPKFWLTSGIQVGHTSFFHTWVSVSVWNACLIKVPWT